MPGGAVRIVPEPRHRLALPPLVGRQREGSVRFRQAPTLGLRWSRALRCLSVLAANPLHIRHLARRIGAAGAVACLAGALVALSPAGSVSAQSADVAVPPQSRGPCAGEVPIVVGSDAAAQSDIYAAAMLAGVIGSDCIVLAGPRDQPMVAEQQARLRDAEAGGFVVGGPAAVPRDKIEDRDMESLFGPDRWATARRVGQHAAGIAPDASATQDVPPRIDGVAVPPQSRGSCAGEVPIVVGSDAAAQSDIYAAAMLAGVIGSDCIVLAGPRDQPMPADQQKRLEAADAGGFVVGGPAAMPTTKIAGRYMMRLSGADRWATARLVGRRAAGDATAGTPTGQALSALDHDACRPPSLEGVWTTVGFPLSEHADPSSGRVKITVLFMDFPDAEATQTTQAEVGQSLRIMEEYLEAQSYGRLDLDIDVVERWWRAPQSYRTYLADDAGGTSGLWPSAGADAVRQADDDYDFSDTDIVLTVFPSAHFGGGLALGPAYADGTALSGIRINTHPSRSNGMPWNWGLTAAHELAHNFGLLDLYPFDAGRHAVGDPPPGTAWVEVEIGLMGLKARYSDPDHSLWLATPVEMLSWSRWQLGWLKPEQVACGVRSGATVRLHPVAKPGEGTAALIVPFSAHEMIVVESRHRLGFDATAPHTHQNGAMPRHGLLEEGVLVYTVDSRIDNGQLPIKIAGDAGNSHVDDFPTLQAGESVTVAGYTIAVTADDGDTHSVQITRDR